MVALGPPPVATHRHGIRLTSSPELSMATGTFQLTLAVPRRSSVPAATSRGHWSHGGSESEGTERGNTESPGRQRDKKKRGGRSELTTHTLIHTQGI